ncbi:MAG TPA: universal stress protein [Pyrinomonadaceae bacterium]|nr:universal stress protein [Pyrinomonadaceae bacterium]
MRLLIAVDSVVTTDMLMNAVASRRWPRGTRARVLSVVEDETVPRKVWREAGYSADAVRQEMRSRGEQISALTVEPLKRLGIEAEVSIMRGDPRWLIAREARKWPADLLLIRAHNRIDFRSWMLGSVARTVVREAPCSVEVVRAAGDDLSVAGNGHTKILLATDGTEHSTVAARAIAVRPWPEGAEVKVMSMVNPVLYSMEEIGLYQGGGTERAHKAIGDAAEILKETGAEISGEVIADRPAKRILDGAKDWGADLIVVGSRDRRGIRRLLSASVSEAVASRAHCSVKVVRAARRGAGVYAAPRRRTAAGRVGGVRR